MESVECNEVYFIFRVFATFAIINSETDQHLKKMLHLFISKYIMKIQIFTHFQTTFIHVLLFMVKNDQQNYFSTQNQTIILLLLILTNLLIVLFSGVRFWIKSQNLHLFHTNKNKDYFFVLYLWPKMAQNGPKITLSQKG